VWLGSQGNTLAF